MTNNSKIKLATQINQSIPLREALSPDQIEAIYAACHNHLIPFACIMHNTYQPAWFHRLIANKLEEVAIGRTKRLMIFMPPRCGKSALSTILFPAWYLGRSPQSEVITVSYSAELSMDFGYKTRNVVDDITYKKKIFPNVRLKEDAQSRGKWLTNKGGSYISVGVGGALSGRGANLLLIDDPIKNSEEANSRLVRDKLWEFYLSTAYTRLEKDAAIVLIQTRWHLDDLAGRILRQAKDTGEQWDVVSLPAILNADYPQYNKHAGEALWPEKFSLEVLQEMKKTLGAYVWSALYQQNPVASEDQEFKEEWLQRIDLSEVLKLSTRRFMTIDTAVSQKDSADYTAITINFVDTQNKWHIMSYRKRVNPKELIELIFTLTRQYNVEKIGIEKTMYSMAIKPFMDEEQRRRNVFLPIEEISHKQINKEVRIRGLIPRYSSLSVWHINQYCRDLEEELLQFPRGLHDDCLDATAYQLELAEQSYEAGVAANGFVYNPYRTRNINPYSPI